MPGPNLAGFATTAAHIHEHKRHGVERGAPDNVVQVDFLEAHPLIRPMDAYRLDPFSS